ncbi:hypothetical protein Nepgr_007450 [Nepenthes gracilis]|uniref:Uncharacterized protein n=1 Tax=Nepenthes gracilis TaxID=150966 RepID=A0AAD3XIF8_NEPGR|nr:hypothetical protein Nepgr_007450 [Nepenthes gracilis]
MSAYCKMQSMSRLICKWRREIRALLPNPPPSQKNRTNAKMPLPLVVPMDQAAAIVASVRELNAALISQSRLSLLMGQAMC